MTMTPMRRIEVLVDAPLLRRVRDVAVAAGARNHMVLSVLSGRFDDAPWVDDQVTGGAGSKVLFVTHVTTDVKERLLAALAPLVEDYSLAITCADAEIVTLTPPR